MTTTFKTLTAAALISSMSVPAFAAAHIDVNNMTCADYMDLSPEDQNKAAMMAVMELNDNVEPADGTDRGTETEETEASEEGAENDADNLRATDSADANDDETRMEEEIGVLNRTCERFSDATLLEAAAGQSGDR
ncbi:hypothetical protein Z946_1789 [Sulfitobacter noctilucicola]|uniref:HdeA/HdeB family protein n=1 Tax=Sulfitobacter noctilucicola TaxID=1342301 RepID=A0A7W6M512_9RHOB|nr:HdeA/HdeB family chaperone [Sulfitobacter noctilucicola]KIN62926.1 hypothetical protein Z946_1789 [Sulfitobacter noctilucicola]MBB4172544.1 hypothetical protein [Sulfitobacter noctilucicola]